jgi:RNA polymerase sigma factor (sigma-70 family)
LWESLTRQTVTARVLVRLVALLVGDLPAAEKIVQDSFVALHRARRELRDSDRAVSYLHRSVVKRSRSATRRRVPAPEHTPVPPPSMPAIEQVMAPLDPAALAAALRALPGHREALVLRYYADLPESQIAAALRISTAAVSRRLAQAMSSLQAVLPTADSIFTSCPPSSETYAGPPHINRLIYLQVAPIFVMGKGDQP